MAAERLRATIAADEDLLATAVALEAVAARQYRYLAAWWEARGEPTLTALFDRLAAMEGRHLAALLARRPGAATTPVHEGGWRGVPSDDVAWRSALLTPRHALSFAIHEEARALAFYNEVALHGAAADMRALAEDLARAESDHAAILRQAQGVAIGRQGGRAPEPLRPNVLPLRVLVA